jgi:hypothetical protein
MPLSYHLAHEKIKAGRKREYGTRHTADGKKTSKVKGKR